MRPCIHDAVLVGFILGEYGRTARSMQQSLPYGTYFLTVEDGMGT